MAVRVTSARFVGRSAELSELEAGLADAAAGRPSVALVAGDSGVGKSRLVRELVAHAGDARVLCGDCVELGEGELPYGPLVAALRPLGREGDPVLAVLPIGVRSELARLLPMLGDAPAAAPNADGEGFGQSRLFEALLALLHALGAESPVLLVLEDIHWADRSTRAFLAFLARSLVDERVLAVATYRVDELHRRHPLRPLLAELRDDAVNVRRVELVPLSHEEIACVLEDILGEPPAPELVERLYARSEGNPLYTEELLAARLDGRGPAPRTLRDALMVRIERLSEPTQEVLRVLAVGRRLDHELLEAASGLEPSALRAALREAFAGQLVVADAEGEHAFRHALLREVAYDDLVPGERTALHRTLAEAMERRSEGRGVDAHVAASIAHHRLAAGDQPAALGASVLAAAEAERVGAHGEAASLLERALELWEHVPHATGLAGMDHVELLVWTSLQHHLGGAEARREPLLRRALAEVDEAADPRRAAALLEHLASAQWMANRSDDALASLRRGLELVPGDTPTVERGGLLAWWARARMLQGRYREAIQAAREARDIADAVGDAEIRGRALNPLGVAQMALGEIEEGAAVLREAIAVARARPALPELGSAAVNLADRLHLAGRSREGLAVARDVLDDLSPTRVSRIWVLLLIAEVSYEIGEWDEAARALPRLDRRPVGTLGLNAGLRRAELALGRGDHDAAGEALDALDALVEGTTEPQFLAAYGALLAQLRRRTGDPDGAAAAVEATIDRLEFCTEDVMRLARISVAGVAVEADRAERARDVGDAAEEALSAQRAEVMLARAAAAAEGGGPLERAWHLTGRADLDRARGGGNAEPWRRAAEAWDAIERIPVGAHCRWRQAEAHLAGGEPEAAAAAARSALAVARRIGAAWLVGELEGLAARARLDLDADPRRADAAPPPDDPFGLTPRERQVLALVAEGATNREIGSRLYMAEKTASVHVSRILAKLDVRTRTQAAAVAHRFRLEDTASR